MKALHMKRILASCLACAIGFGGFSVASAEDAKPAGKRPAGADGKGKGPGGADRAAMKAKLLAKFDTNKDGKLDDEEMAKAREEMKKIRDQAGPGEGKRPGDGPRGADFRAKMLEKFDANKDGKLDKEELATAREEMKKNRPQLDGKGPGGEKKPK